MSTHHHTFFFTIDDQIENRYPEIPFHIAPGTSGISVDIEVLGQDPEAVVYAGCYGPDGWRGWSTGLRPRDFQITETAASTGYRPGPLEPGDWAIAFDLYRIPGEGVEVRLSINIPATREPQAEALAPVAVDPPPRGSTRRLPAPDGLTWYAGDTHAHTLHSDGDESIDQIAARAVRCGFDFCAITDHNTVSHHPLLPASGKRHGIALVPGQEVTTHRGHANVFGDIGWIDFRQPVTSWMAEASRRGGLFSVNHPIDGAWSFLLHLDSPPPALESWHYSWFDDLSSTEPLAYLEALGRSADGQPPILLGGSDFHMVSDGWSLGTPITWVAATDPSPEAILAGMLAGRTALSRGAVGRGSEIDRMVVDPMHGPILVRVEDALVAVDAEGAVLWDAVGRARRIHANQESITDWGTPPYHLVDDRRRILALSR